MICYWQFRVDASLIDPNACTHIIFAFADVSPTGDVHIASAITEAKVLKLVTLKKQNPYLKVMVSMFHNFREVSSDHRTHFTSSLISFMEKYHLDGADIDWEYPLADDRDNFVLLLKEMRKSFAVHNKILSIAAAPCASSASGYNIPAIFEEVDFVNVMLYNFHGGGWQNYTANHANLWHPTSGFNVITCVNHWTSNGAVNEKLIVGIPTYSRNFQLDDAETTGVGALATFKDLGKPGELPVTFSYNVICKNILENGWTRRFEGTKSTGPYAFFGTTWAGYDDVESIKQKVQLVNDSNFGGVVFWSLDHDDYLGDCGDGKFPLVKSVWKV